MRFAEVLYLLTLTPIKDDYGDESYSTTKTEAYANKKSVSSTEFYAAYTNGKEVTAVFEIRAEDYNQERQIEYDCKIYEIIRPIQKGDGFVNLICSDKAV